MNKEEMKTLLRSVGTDEKIIDLMDSAFDSGALWMRETAASLARGSNLETTAQAIEDIVV